MRILLFTALAIAPAAARAEVKSATPAGFVVESKAVVSASADRAYAELGRIGDWWSASHTYSGKGASLSLEPKAGGCFCERWDGGSVEHGRVIYARPGQALRVLAALGPLQGEAVVGTLTWTFKSVAGGTEIVQRYAVGGYVVGGADKYAGPVDQVMTQQFVGLVKNLDK